MKLPRYRIATTPFYVTGSYVRARRSADEAGFTGYVLVLEVQ